MIGGLVGKDTLVTYTEFLPDELPDQVIKYETIDVSSVLYSKEAHSEMDAVCSYNDSVADPNILFQRSHVPLYVRVYQRSMSWSAANLDDFILVDCKIQSISRVPIESMWCGIYWGPAFYNKVFGTGISGTTVGYKQLVDPDTCYSDPNLRVAYSLNQDGSPDNGQWTPGSLTDAVGIVILSETPENGRTNFNWVDYVNQPPTYWWGPRRVGTTIDPFRQNLGSGTGYITSDEDHYYMLSHPEVDYEKMLSALDHSAEGFLPPNAYSFELSFGGTPNVWLSRGPFTLYPGQSIDFTFAFVGGENVHANPTDFADYWDPYHPEIYYSHLDFSELMTNARWAKWVYDNPGVDTDGDGYFGKFRICDGDTVWYEGDGVPDFRADIPPPSPKLKVIPSLGKLVVRWNGYFSENAIDPFTKTKDFEGYRVYMALDDRESSYSTLISWDYPNYNRYYLREKPNHTFMWETKDLPFTIDSLQVLYGDDFYPLRYTKDNPLHIGDTQYSFASVDYNLSGFLPDGVHKVYPEAINPGTDSTLWTEDQLTTEHGNPLPKYYEYEYTIENVLPTVANYVSVTSFDFGFAKGNIPAKESSKRENQTVAYAQTSAETVASQNLDVYVYPNPYIWQKDYHSLGYENRDNTQIPDRSHRINFGNLPPRCKISIFSLDGDLIRSWEHDYNPLDPQAMHDAWDLITRNTMLPVAGLYYWVVESPDRTQIGKFVIIM